MNAKVSVFVNEHGLWFVRIERADNGAVVYIPCTVMAFNRLKESGFPLHASSRVN